LASHLKSNCNPSGAQIPYTFARLSFSAFTYIIPVTAGQKCIRLYFNPASYPKFDTFIARFSAKAGVFTLLSNFSPSLKADTLLREYFISIEEDQILNITFTSSVSDSHAFINGIEILSMPPISITPRLTMRGFLISASKACTASRTALLSRWYTE
jgi:hypothetical protein